MENKHYRMSDAERNRAIEMRRGGKTIPCICETLGRSYSTVRRCVDDGEGINRIKYCKTCRAEIQHNARFCPMCGKQALSAEQICAKNLLQARNECVKFLPQSTRDAADTVMMEAVKLLNGGAPDA